MKKYFRIVSFLLLSATLLMSCNGHEGDGNDDVTPKGSPTATPVKFEKPLGFPNPLIPADNPLTQEGISLGRMLFYDPILSGDSSMSCSSCHKQENAFASNKDFETGIHNQKGDRSSMPLFNMAWINSGFFWDGRASTIEKQAIEPVHNPIELDLSWPEAIKRLQRHPQYPELYKKAFGSSEVTTDNTTKAIAQFLRTIVSANSKFDEAIRLGNGTLSPSEMRGMNLYFNDPRIMGLGEFAGGGSCDHCHGSINMFILQPMDPQLAYRNNGLDSVVNISDFKDIGYAKTAPDNANYGKFKVPSLRNVELTAPYMHDGRFKTLEEVINHYNNGGHPSPTLDKEMARKSFTDNGLGGKLHLTEQDKKDLIAFLKALTDTKLINNEAYSNPF